MKAKRLMATILTLALLVSFSSMISMNAKFEEKPVREYTIPQTLTPPTIDGVMEEGEWTNAYHYFLNDTVGNMWYGTIQGGATVSDAVQNKEDACKGWDVYVQWLNGGEDAAYEETQSSGGLFFAVVAQDKTRFNAPIYGDALNAGVDCIQVAVDPLYTQHPADSFLFDFAPYSRGETGRADDWTGPATCYEHFQFKTDVSQYFQVKKAATLQEDTYTMEFFIPWYTMNVGYEICDQQVGTKIGLGFIMMDWVGASPFYFAMDFGMGYSLSEALSWPDTYNVVTLGGVPAEAKVALNSTEAAVGSEITAEVKIDSSAKDIGGAIFDLKYDNTALELVSTEAEIAESSKFVAEDVDGKKLVDVNANYGGTNDTVRFVGIDLRDDASNAGASVMNVKFKVLKEIKDFPALMLNVVELLDKAEKPIVAEVANNIVSGVIIGDVDLSGEVDVSDAIMAFQFVAGKKTLTDEQKAAGDVDENGFVEVNDAVKIFQVVAGKAEF